MLLDQFQQQSSSTINNIPSQASYFGGAGGNQPREITRNGIRRICESSDALRESFFFQVIEVKHVEGGAGKGQKIVRLKLSDGACHIPGIITLQQFQQQQKSYSAEVKQSSIIEVKSYIKKVVGEGNILIMIKDLRTLPGSIRSTIGTPVSYQEREKQGHFSQEELIDAFDRMDLSIPYKLPPVQPMDIDEDGGGLIDEPKLNQRDIRLLEVDNPEEDMPNPFASGFEGGDVGPPSQDTQMSTQRTAANQDYLNYTPIKALAVGSSDWRIKARLVKKYDRKYYKRENRQGQLLSIDLIDGYGTMIQATFFNECVDKFSHLLNEGSVYLFSNGEVKLANKKFSSIKNDYSLVFNLNAEIVSVADDESIQSQAYNFFTIAEIKAIVDTSRQKTIDFVGVAHHCGQVREKQLKNGTTKDQRTVQLTDESGFLISLCIWGEFAAKFDLGPDEHPVVAIKRASLSDFGGRSLNSNEDSQITINPKIRRTQQLQYWYQHLPDTGSLLSLGGGGKAGDRVNNHMFGDDNSPEGQRKQPVVALENQRLIGEVIELLDSAQQSGNQDLLSSLQNQSFYISAYIWGLKNDDKTYYLACPGEHCKKKVVEESVGWRCINCDKTYQNCIPTYMLSARLADVSDSMYINFYRQEGTALMGLPADKLKEIKDQGDIQVINDTFTDRHYRRFGIIFKARLVTSEFRGRDGDAPRGPQLKFNCMRVVEHSWPQENSLLLQRLKQYEPHFEKEIAQNRAGGGQKQRQKHQFTESQHASRLAEFERKDEEYKRVKMEQQQQRANPQQPPQQAQQSHTNEGGYNRGYQGGGSNGYQGYNRGGYQGGGGYHGNIGYQGGGYRGGGYRGGYNNRRQ